ncbi:unnamed protein product [Amoebophrya sp. A120]|nr:unnamed protein product [Amoebophrya sp. A120]|eukprot:GSA120T00025219001.1
MTTSSDEEAAPGATSGGRGKLEQQHKKELKELKDKCKNEQKKAKSDKQAKREVEAKYKQMEDELVEAFEKKMKDLFGSGQAAEKDEECQEQQQQLSPSGESRSSPSKERSPAGEQTKSAGGDGTRTGESSATRDDTAVADKSPVAGDADASEEPTAGLTEEEKIARKRAKKQRQRENKEQKKKDAVAEREKLMAGVVPLSQIENERMEKQLTREGMQIFDIPSDGNCLYRALNHQLQLAEYPKRFSYDDLRNLCADTLERYKDEYKLFISDEMDGSEASWQQYLQKVRNALWGGDMEINALARALECRVQVYQGDGDPVLSFGEDIADWELRITFHKYLYTSAHYNSLLPL